MSSEPLHTQGRGSAAPLCAHTHTPHTCTHRTFLLTPQTHFTHIHTHHTLLLIPQIHTHTVIAPYTTHTHTHITHTYTHTTHSSSQHTHIHTTTPPYTLYSCNTTDTHTHNHSRPPTYTQSTVAQNSPFLSLSTQSDETLSKSSQLSAKREIKILFSTVLESELKEIDGFQLFT